MSKSRFPNRTGNMPYFSDPLLIPRIRQYLEEHKSLFVSFEDLTDYLQKTYREYGRKKRTALRAVTKKALEIVIQTYGLPTPNASEGNNSETGETGSDDADSQDDDSNSLNNHVTSMYLKHQKSGGQELINISSDEDDSDIVSEDVSKMRKSPVISKIIAKLAKPNPEISTNKPNLENSTSKQSIGAQIVESVQTPKSVSQPESLRKKRRALSPPPTVNKKQKIIEASQPTLKFKDIGGNEKVLKEVVQLLTHMRHPEIFKALGISAPRGFLLHGPPGSGKTLLANAIAGELGLPLLKVAATELVGGMSGESEERIRSLFDQALVTSPCVLFIDEVDAITPNRETAHREMERRIVAQLLSSMDDLSHHENGDQVLVIGATNRPDSIDPALRRAGRFDREVCLGIPDKGARTGILKKLCKGLRLDCSVCLDTIAMMTPGYVGADLKSLTTEAAMAAVNRVFAELKDKKKSNSLNKSVNRNVVSGKESSKVNKETCDEITVVTGSDEKSDIEVIEEKKSKCDEVDNDIIVDVCGEDTVTDNFVTFHEPPLSPDQLASICIKMTDFEEAFKCIQPSAKREGFATVPDVTWEDVGSLKDVRQELQMAIMAPVKYPKEFSSLGLNTPTGILLCGPPGCGKTLLAKAVANEAGINFISVKGPELLNMYVGESERAVRQCFQRARNSQPCVIFFDEIDALCPKRSGMENGASRVVNQLLTEMDGVESRIGVFLMAATNRPDIIDPAVLRPGRLDKIVYIGLPQASDRIDILRALTKNGKQPVLAEDVSLDEIATSEICNGYTGADLAALVREAGICCLKEFMERPAKAKLAVAARHFKAAVKNIRPSVSPKDRARYEQIRLQFGTVSNNK